MSLRSISLAFGMAYVVAAQPSLNVPVPSLAVSGDTPNAIYASPGMGLLRTIDDGQNWRALFLRPAGQRQPAIRTLLVDSSNPRVLFAATDLDDGGIWRSSDAGATWSLASSGLPPGTGAVTWMMQLPAAPSTLYARAGNHLYKTVNSGESWTVRGALPPETTAVTIYPSDASIMYAAQRFGVYRTSDEGANWALAPGYNPIGLPQGTVITSLLVDPADSRNLIAAAAGNGANTGFFRSTNGAQAFTRIFAGQPLELSSPARTPGVIFATSLEPGIIYKSTNNGVVWRRIQAMAAGFVHTLAHHPRNASIVWAGTDRGALISADGGEQWVLQPGVVRPTITTPPLPYEFTLTAGQQGRLDLVVNVIETDRWTVPFQASTTGGNWLAVSSASGTTPSTVLVRVNAGSMEPGEYTGSVRLVSPQAANDLVEVPVRLKVVTPAPLREYTISTLAGTGQPGRFGDGSQARFAALSNPDSVAVDREGNVLISDTGNHNVRRVTANGIINRVAGINDAGFGGDGGAADLAAMRGPRGVVVDPANGWAYIADAGNSRIRRVSPEGGIFPFTQGLESLRGLAIDAEGNVYAALASLHVVAKITPGGEVTRFAGNGLAGYRGDNVEARFARLSGPSDVAVDAQGVVYIADTENHRIRAVDRQGRIRTVAGTGIPGFQGSGQAASQALARPTGVAVDSEGILYIADTENHRIRLVTPSGELQTIAGNGTPGFSGDNGPASAAAFRQPVDVAVDASGNLFVVDSQNIRVRRLQAPVRPAVSAVVNAGDFTARLAPGSAFSVFGSHFGEAPQVLLNGEPATVTYATASQINGVILESATPGSARIQVVSAGVTSRVFPVTISPSAPAWIVAEGRIVALNETGQRNSPEAPAPPGMIVKLYATGVGVTGETPKVLAGEAAWELVSLAPAEGLPGISEVQIRVPADAVAADVALTLFVGEAASSAGAISISSSPSGPSGGPG